MNTPAFTTKPNRVARLQYNYDEGAEREKLPHEVRERLDCECLKVDSAKLKFLYQNALESYSNEMKTQKLQEYNRKYLSKALKGR